MTTRRDLAAELAALTERVERLEARDVPSVPPLAAAEARTPDAGRVVYSGAGPWQEHSIAWQMERTWHDVLATDPGDLVGVLAALASPVRLRIVAALFEGPAGTAALAERVEAGTSGQLFHHLKDLLATGLVHQPQRGTYALRPQHALPLLAVLSAAFDLASPAGSSAP